MLSIARHVLGAGVLATSFCYGIFTPSARAQSLGSTQAPAYSYPAPQYYAASPVYSYPAPQYATTAPVYSYPAPGYYAPAPAYSYPSQSNVYQPQQIDSYEYPAYAYLGRGNSGPGGSYSYYDQDGVEHDYRYPHWTFDYNEWVRLNIK
jgi:hypothetical protein